MLQRPDTFRFNYHAPLAQGLVFAGLGFRGSDRTTHFQDSSLYGNHGTLTNMDPSTDWVFDPYLGRWAIDYNAASDQYVTAGACLTGNENTFSVAIWARRPDTNVYQGIISKDESHREWMLAGYASNEVRFRLYQTDGTTREYTSSDNPWSVANQWYHFAVVVNGVAGANIMYINGVARDITVSGWDGTCMNSASVPLRTGITYSTSYDFTGQLSDPLLYNRCLSPSEIQQLADPSNVMLSGLILPPRRKLWPVATSGTYSTTIEMPVFQLTI